MTGKLILLVLKIMEDLGIMFITELSSDTRKYNKSDELI